MNTSPNRTEPAYELRFRSLESPGRGLSFPCDSHGCVDIDALNATARLNYLYARAVIGLEFLFPAVTVAPLASL